MALKIAVDKEQLKAFCQANGITKLAIFGSAVRDDFDPARSDVDVLVDFAPDKSIGMFEFVRIADTLEIIFGRHVDLVTYRSIHPLLEDEILAEALIQYDKAS